MQTFPSFNSQFILIVGRSLKLNSNVCFFLNGFRFNFHVLVLNLRCLNADIVFAFFKYYLRNAANYFNLPEKDTFLQRHFVICISSKRRKIRFREGNAKCRHLKKTDRKGTLRQVFICLRPRTPYPLPLLHTVHIVYTERVQYTYSHREGGRVGELNQRERERGNRSQSWVKNTNMTECWQKLAISSL